MSDQQRLTIPFSEVSAADNAAVGGKNASLGEMITNLREAGIHVPGGFATTAKAYWRFLDTDDARAELERVLGKLADEDIDLDEAGRRIRERLLNTDFPEDLRDAIATAYRSLAEEAGQREPPVAVRSSATAEDLPDASFAGQQESFLNIRGEAALLDACRRCFASLFTDRAIAYRTNHGFDHMKVALSVGVQHMVRADTGSAGVMFSIDTETGFPDTVLINANWGLGETVVQGSVDPDEYVVFKPLLDDGDYQPIIEKSIGGKEEKVVLAKRGDEPTRRKKTSRKERRSPVLDDDAILELARAAVTIESHYGRPMDIEWARDGESGKLYVVQARPETVQSRREAGALKSWTIRDKGTLRVSGLSVGNSVATGTVCHLKSADDINQFEDGAILVTGMTDPDWVPIMKRASAIVTDHGGRTSHAAIVSRELGLPAVVGTVDATSVLENGDQVTVSCAEGDTGFVYKGIADVEARDVNLDEIPDTRTKVMLNLANPGASFRWWRLPCDGVGLARVEFIINQDIKIHPMALLNPGEVKPRKERREIRRITKAWEDGAAYFVDKLAYGVARIAASQYPKPVIVRMSDFKSNEYVDLLGGAAFEPEEANPMLGWRGASRYYSEGYRDAFLLECRAIRKVRDEIGLDNVIVMIPFCRTPDEADRVLSLMADADLERGVRSLQVYVMAEIPSNIILAEAFSQRFDGFSIGSNDLTQLVLGVDRDSERLAELFDEQHEAVRRSIASLIDQAHHNHCVTGLCGQAPSDHPEFARFLVNSGIDSISVNPDSFVDVKTVVADTESAGTERLSAARSG